MKMFNQNINNLLSFSVFFLIDEFVGLYLNLKYLHKLEGKGLLLKYSYEIRFFSLRVLHAIK